MASISIEQVKNIRKELKRKFPKIKFSVTRENYSTVNISIMSGDIDFSDISPLGHTSINHFYIDDNYSNHINFLTTIRDIAYNFGNYNIENEYESADYGTYPDYYISINIGKFDKHYTYTKEIK